MADTRLDEDEQTSSNPTLDLLLRIFSLCKLCPEDLTRAVWWRCDGSYAPLTIFLNANDLFYWACADCEELTVDNIGLLEETMEECEKIRGVEDSNHGVWLWACRLRKMRPQKAVYFYLNEAEAILFDACGLPRGKT